MWVTRLSKKFELDPEQKFSTEIGGSFWYSDLENNRTQQDGHRSTWSVFSTTNYQAWQWLSLQVNRTLKMPIIFCQIAQPSGHLIIPTKLPIKANLWPMKLITPWHNPFIS